MDAAIPISLRQHRPFTLYWLLTACSSSANQIMTVALGWRVYALTGRALDLGLIGLVQFLPALLLALPAGHAVDRYRRRTILRACLALDAIAALLLCPYPVKLRLAALSLLLPHLALVALVYPLPRVPILVLLAIRYS